MEKPQNISTAHLAAGRAVDQLRRQLGIVIQEDSGAPLGACPVEGLTPELLSQLVGLPKARLRLLLTCARARSLGFGAKEAQTVCLDAQGLTLDVLQALADPLAADVSPTPLTPLPEAPSHDLLLRLAKYSALLPAMLIVESPSLPGEWVRVTLKDVEAYWREPALDIVKLAQAALPIEGAEQATITCLRERYGTSVHLVLAFGDYASMEAPLVRVHSSCITGDILSSLRCDCGSQLKLALEKLNAEGGLLLYLHQEGRGIGIANKLRAYQLQERGVDTYEANLMLGLDEDERDFSIAAAILKKLGVTTLSLLTNNPHKLAALEKAGIRIKKRVPLVIASGAHNQAYLDAKAKKSGHLF